MGKVDKKEILLKEREKGLEYSSEIAIVFKVIKDPTIKQQIKAVYEGDTRAQHALTNKQENFKANDSGLVRFKGIVYFLELA
jgi:hypothetical protein